MTSSACRSAPVAETVGRTAQACRQLASRARQKLAAGGGGARLDVTSAEHRLVTDKFIAASANGDLDGLLEVLAPDAWGDIDYGPAAARPQVVVTGAGRVARHLLHYWGPAATLVSPPVGGQPALLGFLGGELAGVLVFDVRGETIQSVHAIADPAKLSFLSTQLARSRLTSGGGRGPAPTALALAAGRSVRPPSPLT